MTVANVGLDFSKASFDACVLIEEQEHHKQFDNNRSGWVSFSKWQSAFGAAKVNIVFEPTARYAEGASEFLFHTADYRLFQAHPKKFSDFKNSLDFRTKTDSVDAWALAVYASERAGRTGKAGLRDFVPKTDVQKELRDVKLRLRSLYKRKSALISQSECGIVSAEIAADIQEELESIEARIDRVLEHAKKVISQDRQLSRDLELLETIKGVGFKTALALVCVIDFRRFASGDDLVCFLGLSNRRKRSGTSVKTRERLSKAGDSYIRAALYFPAQSAINHNEQLRAFAERLKARGKIHPVVRSAVARKIITIAWALVKNQLPYDPAYQRVA